MPNAKNNQPPSISIPAFLKDTNHDAVLNRLPYLAWWQEFRDPLLNQLVDKALLYNNDITIAKQSIRVAHAELQTIRLNWLPAVSILAGFSQNPALGNPGVFYGILPSYYQNFFSLYFQQKTAEYMLQRSKAYYLGVRLTVIGQVVSGYFSLLAWHHQLKLLEQIEKEQQALLTSIKLAQTQGLANNRQWLMIQSQLQEVRGQKKQIQSNLVASENALRYLVNEPPGPIHVKDSFADLTSQAVPLNKINTHVILSRPDVMIAVYSLKAACGGVYVAESQLLPSMTLDYLAGQASMDGSFKVPTHYPRYSDVYATFNLSPTLFGQILTRKAIFNKRLAEYNEVIQNALRLIANRIDANEKSMAKYREDRDSLQSIIQRYRLQQDLYQKGLISHNELLTSHIELNQQDFRLTLSKLEQLTSVINLYQELAGGIHYCKKTS